MNFHAFWRSELKAMSDLLADRIVGPRLGPESRGRSGPVRRSRGGRAAALAAVGGLTGSRGTLCYAGAVPGV
jgi:hypothetical protein